MKDLAEKINADREFTMEAYNYIRSELDKETTKPLRKRDFDRIEQLTAQLNELTGDNSDSEQPDTSELYKRIRNYEKTSKKPFSVMKRFAPVLCCMVLVLAANCITVLAYDMNIISAVIKFTQGGFSVDFGNQPEKIVLPTSEDDPYGLIAKLAEYDIEFETPHYIPEGFELEHTSSNTNKNVSSMVRFIFKKGNQSISFDFEVYQNDVGQIGIPSDHYNISETEINGYPAIVSKEDNQYTITYQKDKTVFFMFADGVPYDECEKIVESIK